MYYDQGLKGLQMNSEARQSSRVKRLGIAIIGGFLLLVGIVAIPYPGPGWLIVFGALALLSTEFEWAHNLRTKLKSYYTAWEIWVEKQSIFLRITLWLLTAAIVVATVWLLNGYGYLNDFFGLHLEWLRSPLPWF